MVIPLMKLVPITFKEACEFIEKHHSHHCSPQGWKFGIGLLKENSLVGVITIGRPVARLLDDGLTLEVTRCCTDGSKNVASKLYAAAWRAVKNMGYTRLITYTLVTEKGICLKAAGWHLVGQCGGGSWNRPKRFRKDKHPIIQKNLWEAV